MGTEDVSASCATTKPSKAMVIGEDSKSAKSSKPAVSTLGKTAAPSQFGWSTYMQMQAYYSAGPTPPPLITSSATPQSYVWGNQHPSMQSYATPPQYPVLYHHGGFCANPNLLAGLALKISEADRKVPYGEYWDSKRIYKGSSGNVELVGGRSGDTTKPALDSGNVGASQSGRESSSDGSDEKANQTEISEMKKRSFDQMLANGSIAHNSSSSNCCGANQVSDMGSLVVSMPPSTLNMGMNSSAGSQSMNVRPNDSGVSQPGVPAMIVGREEILSEKLIQDGSELKKERKRQSNNESARRLRIHRKQNYDNLQAQVEALSKETSLLSSDLMRHSECCVKLKSENKSLLTELKQICGSDVISILEAKNPDLVLQSVNGESDSYSPESPSKHNLSPDHDHQSIDVSISNCEVEAGCN